MLRRITWPAPLTFCGTRPRRMRVAPAYPLGTGRPDRPTGQPRGGAVGTFAAPVTAAGGRGAQPSLIEHALARRRGRETYRSRSRRARACMLKKMRRHYRRSSKRHEVSAPWPVAPKRLCPRPSPAERCAHVRHGPFADAGISTSRSSPAAANRSAATTIMFPYHVHSSELPGNLWVRAGAG